MAACVRAFRGVFRAIWIVLYKEFWMVFTASWILYRAFYRDRQNAFVVFAFCVLLHRGSDYRESLKPQGCDATRRVRAASARRLACGGLPARRSWRRAAAVEGERPRLEPGALHARPATQLSCALLSACIPRQTFARHHCLASSDFCGLLVILARIYCRRRSLPPRSAR